MKFLTKACVGMLLAASAMSTPAFAQEEEAPSGPFTLSGGIAVTSDYRFRGISLSNEKVAVQPTLTHLGPQWNAAHSRHHRVAWVARVLSPRPVPGTAQE